MRLGATLADGAGYPIAEWARRLADAGFQSLWTPEIVGRGALVPDPFVTLAAAAAVTRDVELGTATVQVPLHHPVELAHRMLSLLSVAGPRVCFGLSPGSTDTDFHAYDRDYPSRFDTLAATLPRLRTLLRDGLDDEVVLDPSLAVHPTLLLGSWGARVRWAATDFDGWLASGLRRSPGRIIEALGRFRAAGGGRAIVCAIPVTAQTHLPQLADQLHGYAEAGFDDAVVWIQPGGADPEQVVALLG